VSMVEKVARALYAHEWNETQLDVVPAPYLELARAAIEAMREPSEGMARMGLMSTPFEYADFEKLDDGRWYVRGYWDAIIDAALKGDE
jgi:hypothetical protein